MSVSEFDIEAFVANMVCVRERIERSAFKNETPRDLEIENISNRLVSAEFLLVAILSCLDKNILNTLSENIKSKIKQSNYIDAEMHCRMTLIYDILNRVADCESLTKNK
ncbi:hypothetical protein DO659_25990 [Salmonella enterica subsp. enterica serovar Minnesota]|nr:hypothetical protein [Salmonella enterica subsp. enterica serovar Minnesota]ECI4645523.1 hypothetical protein [Salmonella enterica subsp. salamae]